MDISEWSGAGPHRWGSVVRPSPQASDFALGAVSDTAFIIIDDWVGNWDVWVLSFDVGPE